MHELQLSTTHRWRSSALRKLHEIVTKCKHQGDYGLTERHYHIPSKPKDVFDDCLGRVRYGRCHGVSIPCDRQLPCRNCLTSTGEKSCRDQVEEGLRIYNAKPTYCSTRREAKNARTQDGNSVEETLDDDTTSEEDSTADESDFDEDFYGDDQSSAGPSNAR